MPRISTLFQRTYFAALVAAASLAAPVANAAPLNLVLSDTPDIVSGFIDVSYDSASQQLSASGFALEIDVDGGPTIAITSGTFDITASIDNSGNLLGGTFEIGGTIADLGFNSGTLITGDLINFGFRPEGGDPLEFVFDITGGDAAGLFLAEGAFGGIILSGTGFGGSFAADFANDGISGVADTAPVPVPAAAWLLMSGLAGLAGFRSRRA